ncbi:MAG: hypothetical protein AAFZ17_11100 [Cyanobacteria bacterium J06650_10]
MFVPTVTDAPASTVSDELFSVGVSPANTPQTESTTESTTEPALESMRHLLFGSPMALEITIKRLHKLGYAEPNDWSRPISTGRPGEVMAILTKKVDVS